MRWTAGSSLKFRPWSCNIRPMQAQCWANVTCFLSKPLPRRDGDYPGGAAALTAVLRQWRIIRSRLNPEHPHPQWYMPGQGQRQQPITAAVLMRGQVQRLQPMRTAVVILLRNYTVWIGKLNYANPFSIFSAGIDVYIHQILTTN